MGRHMGLMKRRRIEDDLRIQRVGVDEVRIGDGAHRIGEGPRLDVDPDRRVPAGAEGAHQGFAQMS